MLLYAVVAKNICPICTTYDARLAGGETGDDEAGEDYGEPGQQDGRADQAQLPAAESLHTTIYCSHLCSW